MSNWLEEKEKEIAKLIQQEKPNEKERKQAEDLIECVGIAYKQGQVDKEHELFKGWKVGDECWAIETQCKKPIKTEIFRFEISDETRVVIDNDFEAESVPIINIFRTKAEAVAELERRRQK